MNRALPKIKETPEELRDLLKAEQHVKKTNRLQALYLIASKQTRSRKNLAELLGLNRNTISSWLQLYEEKGLDGLLRIYRPAGAPSKIPEAAVKQIKATLQTEKGFRTYKEIHQMVADEHQIAVGYSTVHHLVRYKLGAKAKSPRPSNPKKTKLR